MSAGERIAEILDIAQDKFAGFLAVADNDHKYIHEGKAFSLMGNTGSLTAGTGKYYFTLLTPPASSGIYIHLRPALIAATANQMMLQLHEGSVVGSAGSVAVPVNLNRNSAKLSQAVVRTGAGTVTDGTLLMQWVVGSGSGAQGAGGGAGGTVERLLKPGTLYTFTITNIGAVTASTGYFEMFYYDETKG